MKKTILTLVAALMVTSSSYATQTARKFASAEDEAEFVILETLAKDSGSKIEKCITRVEEAGCKLSNNDKDRIEDNILSCKHLDSKKGTTSQEIFLLKNAGKVVVLTTKTPISREKCSRTKYSVGSAIQEIKVINNKTWMYTQSGQLFYMNADEQFAEVYTAGGKSYSGIVDIKGDNDAVKLIFSNGQDFSLTPEGLSKRTQKVVKFESVPTNASLFRDR